MALNFPDSPNNGDQSSQSNGVLYQWDASKTRWFVVSTDPDSGSLFDAKLAGYLSTGLHAQYTSDLDDIAANSVYAFDESLVTNAPADMPAGSNGIILTDWAGNGIAASQVIYGVGSHADLQAAQWQRNRTGGGWEAWIKTVDGGAFTLRLAGYADDGQHVRYAADLDDIIVNSTYNFLGTDVTNEPGDFSSTDWGYITTFMHSENTLTATQVLYGMNGTNRYKQWMRHKLSGVWDAWILVVSGPKTSVAYGRIDSGGNVTKDNGFFTAVDAGTGILDITFNNAQANANYMINCQVETTLSRICTIISPTNTGFRILGFTSSDGVATNVTINVVCTRADGNVFV